MHRKLINWRRNSEYLGDGKGSSPGKKKHLFEKKIITNYQSKQMRI